MKYKKYRYCQAFVDKKGVFAGFVTSDVLIKPMTRYVRNKKAIYIMEKSENEKHIKEAKANLTLKCRPFVKNGYVKIGKQLCYNYGNKVEIK